MKNIKSLSIILFCLTISMVSCKDKETTEQSEQNTVVPLKLFDANNLNTGSAWHYTCNQGCAGGAAAAGNCSTCGKTLVHNQAFHANTNNNVTNTSTSPIVNPTNPAATQNPEPSQNASGVWHYTCSKGCSGGAGSAGKCGNCGTTLAHNTAYH